MPEETNPEQPARPTGQPTRPREHPWVGLPVYLHAPPRSLTAGFPRADDPGRRDLETARVLRCLRPYLAVHLPPREGRRARYLMLRIGPIPAGTTVAYNAVVEEVEQDLEPGQHAHKLARAFVEGRAYVRLAEDEGRPPAVDEGIVKVLSRYPEALNDLYAKVPRLVSKPQNGSEDETGGTALHLG